MATINQTCPVCGKIFSVASHRLKHGRGKTCSRACQYRLNSVSLRRKDDEGRPLPLAVSKQCPICLKTFTIPRKDADHAERIGMPRTYCSRTCQHTSPEWKAALGKSLRSSDAAKAARHRSIAAMNAIPSSERSRRTRDAWRNTETRQRIMDGIKQRSESPEWRNAPHFRRGAEHPRYTGNASERAVAISRYEYRQWRTAVYERDDYTCQSCQKRGGNLQAHHVKSWASFPALRYDVANGQTLCAECHHALHRKH